MGQTKIEWNLKSFPISISSGNSFLLKQSVSLEISANLMNLGNARVPAVVTTYKVLYFDVFIILHASYNNRSIILVAKSSSYSF